MENTLKSLIHKAIQDIYNISFDEIALQPTRQEFEGEFTFVTFALNKQLKSNPENIANAIGNKLLQTNSIVASYNVVKGFLNISLHKNVWTSTLKSISENKQIGQLNSNGKKVMVEYCGPNTNKPLHLGHVRNILIGKSVINILQAAGYDVIKANIINDKGVHICKSMYAWIKNGNGSTPESTHMKGDHFVGKYYVEFDKILKAEIAQLIQEGKTEEEAKKEAPCMKAVQEMLVKWENNDEYTRNIWQMMNAWVYEGFEQTYKKLGATFDVVYYESETYTLGKEICENAEKEGIFFRKPDNSLWINLEDVGLDQKLVLRNDGTSVYITQDIATAILRHQKFNIENIIYVVGNEQDYHFKVLKEILKKMGFSTLGNGIHHLSYGMVDLPSGKMKSREGTVVDADDLIDEMIETAKQKTIEKQSEQGVQAFEHDEQEALYNKLGMAAMKFFLLKVNPQKRLLFNPAESIDLQGFTGPFIQYTFTRIQSILRNIKSQKIYTTHTFENVELHDLELEHIKLLNEYENVILKAANNYDPSEIANYSFNVAKHYNKLYAELSVSKENDESKRSLRILLSEITADILQKSLALLGIETVERM